MQGMALEDFLRTYDLYDKGVDAITQDDAGRMRFVFELFHCDDPARNDEAMNYRLTVIFRPEDVILHEGVLRHEEGGWLGEVLELQTEGDTARLGIEWRSLVDRTCSWTSLSLRGGPLQAEEILSRRR